MSIAPERPPANSPIRFSIAVVLALVGMLGLFLGAMRNGSALAMKLTWTATALALLVGLLGALVRRGEAAWVGFALFGWGYALHSLDRVVAPNLYQKFVFADVLEAIVPEMHPMPSSRPVVPAINGQFLRQFGGEAYVARVDDPGLLATLTDPELDLLRDFQAKFLAFQRSEDIVRSRRVHARNIGHALIALTLGLSGALAGRWIAGRPSSRVGSIAGETSVDRADL